jgi:hypothetical protein
MRSLRALAAASLLWFAAPVAYAQTVAFEVGQVWSLKAPMDPAARIRVGRIENEGQTVHISLWGQPIEATGPLGSPLVAGHLPISAEALADSVDRVVAEQPPEGLSFEEGYSQWRDAQGGVFTISVAEIVTVMVEMIAGTPSPTEK